MSILERHGLRFVVQEEHDEQSGPPWENEDGHGVISGWEIRDPINGEYVLVSDRSAHCFYNMAESLKLAEKDGWGLSPDEEKKLAKRLHRKPTKKQVIAAAVDADFERMRAWCNNEWSYIGVVVTLLDTDGKPTDEEASLWGIESDAGAYLDDVANELADEIASRVGDAKVLTKTIRVREEP